MLRINLLFSRADHARDGPGRGGKRQPNRYATKGRTRNHLAGSEKGPWAANTRQPSQTGLSKAQRSVNSNFTAPSRQVHRSRCGVPSLTATFLRESPYAQILVLHGSALDRSALDRAVRCWFFGSIEPPNSEIQYG